ncbi:MAG TPA: M56 family metallopeptidase [Bryobacteraceae bacterium]|nr:M56 family metallopeptidase [Bryobacteraceae bacterium]
MPFFFGLFWKSGIVLGAALCLNRLVRKNSADLRRLVLSTSVAALLLAMAATPILPRWTAVMPPWLRFQRPSHASRSSQAARQVALPGEPEPAPYYFPPASPQTTSRHTDLTAWLLPLLWSLGAATLLMRYARSLHGLRRLREASEPVTDPNVLVEAARHGSPARLLQSETIAAPVTWGIIRPVILVPTGFEALSREYREAVLCHELAHIRAGDFLMRSLAEIARAALWFQPLMWIVRRQLHEEQELACDNRVLAAGGKPSAYAKLLLEWDARPGMDFLIAVGIANRSCLKRRLHALLEPGLRRNTVARAVVAGAWFLALAVALPLAAVSVTQDAPARPTPARVAHVENRAAIGTDQARTTAPVQIAQTAPAPRTAFQLPAPAPAADSPVPGDAAIAGDWAGVLNLPQNKLRIVLHITGPDNALRATHDSPDQGMAGMTVDSIALSGSTLSFAIQYLDVKFSGDVNTNGTIVGTFVQRGTGVPLVLTRAVAPSAPPQLLTRPALPVTGGVFHHDRSGIEFTLPAGWSVLGMETATNDPGEMAVLKVSDHKAVFASVWMRQTETHPADIPRLLDAALTRKIASRAGKTGAVDEAVVNDFKIRSGSVEHTLINGQQALRAIGDYQESGRSITELLVWVYTEHARTYSLLRAESSQIETLQPAFEQLIQSAKIP